MKPLFIRYNACKEPCDVAEGPCVCGAWHPKEEWYQLLKDKLVERAGGGLGKQGEQVDKK